MSAGVPLALVLAVAGAAPGPVVVGAAGDIACDTQDPDFHRGTGDRAGCAERATSDLLLALKPQAVLVLGDEQYPRGELQGFQTSFDPTWGRLKAVLHPTPGNHEYGTRGAAGYFAYFGARAGTPGEGWYSFDVGAWHLVALNSNCGQVGCGPDSPQVRWLKADLAAHRGRCTLAFWHHPRFSSGLHGSALDVSPFWDALYAAGADVVLNGHDHHYERFAPQAPDGRADPTRGVREFVVGTGGKSAYPIPHALPNSEAHRTGTFGVLALTLRPDSYAWEFLATDHSFHDAGEGRCHVGGR